MPYDAVFNANEIVPQQSGGGHPVGNKFPFTVTSTEIKKVKDKEAGYFEVELTSPHGSIKTRYSLWTESDVARKIAAGQLSALCHATGIFNVDFKNDGAALRGAIGLMDVGFQKGEEPSAEKPAGGWVELKKVYDKNGNEPGKAAQTPQQTQQQPQGGQVQSGGFDPKPNAAPSGGGNGGGGWGGGAPNGSGGQPNGAGGGWQQSGTGTTEKPPWG